MRRSNRSQWIFLFLAATSGPLLCVSTSAAKLNHGNSITVFSGARLIDGTGEPPINRSVLVIQGGRIIAAGSKRRVSYPKGARIIDVRGKTIIPGVINAHGHLGLVVGAANSAAGYTRQNILKELAQYEQYGVTSMLSLGLNRDLVYSLRAQQRRGLLGGATIFTAGRGIGVPGGLPTGPLAPVSFASR